MTEKTLNEDLLVVLDLETTGLNPATEAILEIGLVIYDRTQDQILDSCNWVTRPVQRSINDRTRFVMKELKDVRSGCDPFVEEMHTKNGLWDELETTTATLFNAGTEISEWFQMNGLDLKNEIYTVAGNGPDRFDRPFLRYNSAPLNNLDSIFHYRSLDISNLFHAHLMAGHDLNKDRPPRVKSNHRALDDAFQSLEDWRWIVHSLNSGRLVIPSSTYRSLPEARVVDRTTTPHLY